MMCLSLWQPWASLIALGEKTLETRSWETSYRGPIAIHAAKKWGGDFRQTCVIREPFRSVLIQHGVIRPSAQYGMQSPVVDLPLGRIVAVATLVDILPTYGIERRKSWKDGSLPHARHELAFGNYEQGRWAWVLDNVRPLRTGVPIRGYQRIWTLEDHIAELVNRLAA